jgi:hypothetical protein
MRPGVIRWSFLAAVDDGARRLDQRWGPMSLLMYRVLYAALNHLV